MSRETKGKVLVTVGLLAAVFGASLAGGSFALAQGALPAPPTAEKALSAAPQPVQATKTPVAAVVLPAPSGAPAAVSVAVATPAFSVSMLLDWLLKLASIALATLIPLLLQRWLGGKISADTLAAYSKLALDAVGHTEELAHQAVKAGTPKLDSNAKANAAVSYVLQAANALKLRPMAETAVKQMIDAKLGASRMPAGPDAPKIEEVPK